MYLVDWFLVIVPIKFSYGLTKPESAVFVLFTLCLIATLFVDGGVISMILLCGKHYLPVGFKKK